MAKASPEQIREYRHRRKIAFLIELSVVPIAPIVGMTLFACFTDHGGWAKFVAISGFLLVFADGQVADVHISGAPFVITRCLAGRDKLGLVICSRDNAMIVEQILPMTSINHEMAIKQTSKPAKVNNPRYLVGLLHACSLMVHQIFKPEDHVPFLEFHLDLVGAPGLEIRFEFSAGVPMCKKTDVMSLHCKRPLAWINQDRADGLRLPKANVNTVDRLQGGLSRA